MMYSASWDDTRAEFPNIRIRGGFGSEIEAQAYLDDAIGEFVSSSIVVASNTIPTDRTFRNAWENAIDKVRTNIPKARLIAHAFRRVKRAAEFAPLDIQSTIPAKAGVAEQARQVIRDRDAQRQIDIEAAVTESELKSALGE